MTKCASGGMVLSGVMNSNLLVIAPASSAWPRLSELTLTANSLGRRVSEAQQLYSSIGWVEVRVVVHILSPVAVWLQVGLTSPYSLSVRGVSGCNGVPPERSICNVRTALLLSRGWEVEAVALKWPSEGVRSKRDAV